MMFRLIRENVERLVESEREKQALIKEGYKEISVTEANPGLTKDEKAKQEPKKKAAEA